VDAQEIGNGDRHDARQSAPSALVPGVDDGIVEEGCGVAGGAVASAWIQRGDPAAKTADDSEKKSIDHVHTIAGSKTR